LRTPVGAVGEQARISARTSSGVRSSAGSFLDAADARVAWVAPGGRARRAVEAFTTDFRG
jgi:hypothetical protein